MMEYHSLSATIDGEKKYVCIFLVFLTDQLKKMSHYDLTISNSQNIIPKRPRPMRFNLMKNTEFKNVVRYMSLNHAGRKDIALSSLSV